MRVLCDVHIPFRLVNRLREMGVDATHVNRGLDGSRTTDAAICTFVDQGGIYSCKWFEASGPQTFCPGRCAAEGIKLR